MRTVALRGLGAAFVLVAFTALGGLSRAPVPVGVDGVDGIEEAGVIRLSWRTREPRDGACRRPSPEDLERLPAHMRNPDACMARGTSFRLRVSVDGEHRVDETFEPAGARGDRPIFVLRDLPVEAGRHRLEVRFEPVDDSAPTATLERSVAVAAGQVVLITYDPEREELVLGGAK